MPGRLGPSRLGARRSTKAARSARPPASPMHRPPCRPTRKPPDSTHRRHHAPAPLVPRPVSAAYSGASTRTTKTISRPGAHGPPTQRWTQWPSSGRRSLVARPETPGSARRDRQRDGRPKRRPQCGNAAAKWDRAPSASPRRRRDGAHGAARAPDLPASGCDRGSAAAD